MYGESSRIACQKRSLFPIGEYDKAPVPYKKKCIKQGVFFGRTTHKTLNFTYYMKDSEGIQAVTLKETEDKLKDVVTVYSAPDYGSTFAQDECQKFLGFNLQKDVVFNSDSDHQCDLHQPEKPNSYHSHFKVSKGETELFVGKLFLRHKVDSDKEKHSRQFSTAKEILFSKNSLKAIFFPDGNYVQNDSCISMFKSKTLTEEDMQYAIGVDVD